VAEQPDPWAPARARIASLAPDALLKWQKQLQDTVAMSVAQATRCGLDHLPGWHGVTGWPLLKLIEERLNHPFIPAS